MSKFSNNFSKPQDLDALYEAYLGTKDTITKEWLKEPPQKLNGEVFLGNIHGHGFYFVEKEDKLFYDGLFYANKLQGYAQVFYNDGCNFQGLFQDNKRFGPGVLTYPNGEQDVGLWSGKYMIRMGSLNEKNFMPRLATTPEGQLKLLKYRYLVPVCFEHEDFAYSLLKDLGANEEVLQRSQELYNLEVENKHSIFFNQNLFDKRFYGAQDCFIDVVLSDEEEDTPEEVPEEETEEVPSGRLDINQERVRQISQQLEIIEGKLQAVKEKRIEIEKKVEICRTCCDYTRHYEEENVNAEDQTNYGAMDTRVDTDAVTNGTYDAFGAFETTTGAFSPGYTGRRPIETVTFGAGAKSIDTENFSISQVSDIPGWSVRTTSEADMFNDTDLVDTDFLPQESSSRVVTQIKDYLMDTCICDEEMQAGELYEMEKDLEAVTRDEFFYESIMKNLKQKLEMHLQKSQDITKVRTKKILVKDVLAWNNEKFCMRMLKHSFLHRNTEYMVNFKVPDLLAGNRIQFGKPGPHERNCTEFLTACSKGDVKAIFKHIRKDQIDINVCDSKGNNGIFFAAINGHSHTIQTLVNLGAKLDQENDEGLLPLSMCLLEYLAKKHNVENWEESFLPDFESSSPEQEGAYKWYPNLSVLNLLSKQGNNRGVIAEIREGNPKAGKERSHYLFDTGFITPAELQVTQHEGSQVRKNSQNAVGFLQIGPATKEAIEDCIKTLLECGANPNTAESPLPPLMLSLFTENPRLVEWILGAGANVNVTIGEELTALHVISSLKSCQANVDICSLLMTYDCDPRHKTTGEHWPDQKEIILGHNVNPEDVEDLGKTPLHILCMRRDFSIDVSSFFKKMAVIFCESITDCNEKYLGHTPLSLAVLVGNNRLVETFMSTLVTDPHQLLDNNMGNLLTIYILKRYQHLLPPNAKDILKYLVELGVNPLRPVGQFENVIAFMQKEHEVLPTDKKGKKSKPQGLNVSKKAEKGKGNVQNEIKDYLYELGRDTVIKRIQLQAVENLYNLIEDNWTQHECVSLLAQFLTPIDAISNLQILFRHGRIKSERFNKEICLELVDIVSKHQKEIKAKMETKAKGSKKSKTKVNKFQSNIVENVPATPDYDHILDMVDFTVIKKIKSKYQLILPGLDSPSKYKVCFQCLRGRNKTLLVCPKCQLISFCSDQCNKANLKLRTLHYCDLNFYASESTKMESPDDLDFKESFSELYSRIRESCKDRWLKKREEEKELERKQLEDEMKSDTYGIKALRRLKKPTNLKMKTPTILSLFGSVDGSPRLGETSKVKIYRSVSTKTCSATEPSSSVNTQQKTRSEAKYKCMVNQKHVSSMLELPSVEHKGKKQQTKIACTGNQLCDCEKCKIGKPECTTKFKSSPTNTKAGKKEKVKKDVSIQVAETEAEITVRRLRKIPSRYKDFIGLLTRYFPDVNFSSLLLPYACYSNGHLYYKFLDNDLYARTYSMV